MSDNIKVAVRVRPFIERELNVDNPQCIITMKGNGTSIHNPKSEGKGQDEEFFYDQSIWSFSPKDPHFVSQADVFDMVGRVALGAAFEGYNTCVFAYGQTGSGKTYTMMGKREEDKEAGLIPRICNKLFAQIEETEGKGIRFKTEVSYFEIYNERVQDLLSAGNGIQTLKVREHPKDGPYVNDLTSCLVSDFGAIKERMDYGILHRMIVTTMMGQCSSRSHAIFTIKMTMAQMQEEGPSEIISKMHLIDLAGSERPPTSGATGERLKEGGNINKSLVTLGLVISKLAEEGASKRGSFVPYRDSVLTRLLKDFLGRNSKSFLIATISPSELNYPESLRTLYFADSAKRVKNRAVINEDPNVKLIKDLKSEIENLRKFIHINQLQGGDRFLKEHEQMKANLIEKEGKINELRKAWTEKWQETKKVIEENELAVTSKELDSIDIMNEHCQLEYEEDVRLIPKDGNCAVNNKQVTECVKLYHGDVLRFRKCMSLDDDVFNYAKLKIL